MITLNNFLLLLINKVKRKKLIKLVMYFLKRDLESEPLEYQSVRLFNV